MFGKLKEALSKLKKDVAEAPEDKPKEEKKAEEKISIKEKIAAKFKKKEDEAPSKDLEKEDKKGFFQKRSEDKISSALEDFEDQLIQNNVAYEITERILDEIKEELLENKKKASSEIISEKLAEILTDVLTKPKQIDLLAEKKKPLILLFVGVNGVGKTTTIAKVAHLFKKNKKSCVMAAGDTWRSGAIQQLGKHADKLKIKMISHKYGADPAAVAYDAIAHAKAKKLDVVLIDTAGRQHSAEDLMTELAKIKRVAKPDFTIFIGESVTGNDCVEQVRTFNEKIGIDGVILAKADVDESGGAVISVSYESGKPILYLGTGQTYDSLEPFSAKKILKRILS